MGAAESTGIVLPNMIEETSTSSTVLPSGSSMYAVTHWPLLFRFKVSGSISIVAGVGAILDIQMSEFPDLSDCHMIQTSLLIKAAYGTLSLHILVVSRLGSDQVFPLSVVVLQ